MMDSASWRSKRGYQKEPPIVTAALRLKPIGQAGQVIEISIMINRANSRFIIKLTSFKLQGNNKTSLFKKKNFNSNSVKWENMERGVRRRLDIRDAAQDMSCTAKTLSNLTHWMKSSFQPNNQSWWLLKQWKYDQDDFSYFYVVSVEFEWSVIYDDEILVLYS